MFLSDSELKSCCMIALESSFSCGAAKIAGKWLGKFGQRRSNAFSDEAKTTAIARALTAV